MPRTAPRTEDRRPLRRPARAGVRATAGDQAGLSLVEVIVSISLLGMFALVFAPLVYNGLAITGNQATVAYSAQRAASYIDDARAATTASASCAALLAATSSAAPVISTDPRNVRVKVSGAVTGCATVPTVPTAVTLTVTACHAADAADAAACTTADRTLTVVSTNIMVRG